MFISIVLGNDQNIPHSLLSDPTFMILHLCKKIDQIKYVKQNGKYSVFLKPLNMPQSRAGTTKFACTMQAFS